MASTKARSVFVVSFAAGLLASAAVLVSPEGAAEPQTYFGLPGVDTLEPEEARSAPRRGPKTVSREDAVSVRRRQRRAPVDAALQLAVATDESSHGAAIVLVGSREPVRREPEATGAPPLPRLATRIARSVETRDWLEEPWIEPIDLRDRITDHAGDGNDEWAQAMLSGLDAAVATPGPADPVTRDAVDALAELADYGMQAADEDPDAARASQTRRTALAVSRRAELWDAAGEVCCEGGAVADGQGQGALAADVRSLLTAIERFEACPCVATASETRGQMDRLAVHKVAGIDKLSRAFRDHYLAPNVRIAATAAFADRLMPEPAVERGPVAETILGRAVRGNRVVKRSTRVVFVPDGNDVRLDLEVHGDVYSRTVTDAGPVSLNSNSTSTFTVRKPIKLCSQGLLVGDARAVASNRSKVAGMQTSFDNIPLMGSLVRTIARSQQESSMPEANREAARKVINQACRDVDAQSEPQLADLERRVVEKVWNPLVSLGLDPVAMALQTTDEMATVRLRLAGEGQLSGHTPRPRVPECAELSVQLHDTCLNNAFDRLEIAGRLFPLADLYQHVGDKLGIEVVIPDDLPDNVTIGFEEYEPIRVECADGLVHVTVRIDSIESGRRDWYDVEAGVSYRLVSQDPQVVLEREGPIRIGGEGHRGRFEIGLRTVFGKIFPKERPIPLLPERLAGDPRLADLDVCQAVVTDGWLAIALGPGRDAVPATARVPLEPVVRK